MGRRRSNIIGLAAALAVFVLGGSLAQAQPPGQQGQPTRRVQVPRRGSDTNSAQERWFSMPPDERQVFQQNAERWIKMGPEERKLMREREKNYRERIKNEADATLRDSGLRLEGERRDLFEQRYLQERRRIEHSLLKELDTRREQELPALRERLKKEFQQPSTSSPAASTSPKKKTGGN